MFSSSASLKYNSKIKSCFITVPKNWSKHLQILSHETIFRLEYGSKIGFFSWDGRTYSKTDNEIEINEYYAKKIGFDECDVTVHCFENISPCKQADLITSPDDFEIIESNTVHLEKNIRNQIIVIWKNQTFPIWINKYPLIVKIIQTDPDITPIKLVEETYLNIKPNNMKSEFNTANDSLNKIQKEINYFTIFLQYLSYFSIFLQYFNFYRSFFNYSQKKSIEESILKRHSSNPGHLQIKNIKTNWSNFICKVAIDITARVIPLEDLFNSNCLSHSKISHKIKNSFHPSVLYIGISAINLEVEHFIAKVTKCLSPSENTDKKSNLIQRSKKEKKNNEYRFSSTIVQVIVFNDYEISCNKCFKNELNTILQAQYVIVPDSIRKVLGLEISSQIHLQSVNYEPSLLDDLNLSPLSQMRYSFEEFKNQWYENICKTTEPFVYCNNTLINFQAKNGDTADFIINASSEYTSETNDDQPYGIITPQMLTNINFVEDIVEPVKINGIKLPCQNLKIIEQNSIDIGLSELGGIEALSNEGLQFLELWLNLSSITDSILPKYSNNTAVLLICGLRGTGKTTLALNLVQKLSKLPHYVYHHIISCRKFQGKRGEVLWKNWRKECFEIVHRQPSVVIIDDLDIIAPAPLTPEQERSIDGFHFHKIVNAFLNLIDFIRSSESKICLIVTAKSVQSLHPLLTSTRGNHTFQLILDIAIPDKEQRLAMIKALIESKSYLSIECDKHLSEFAFKTEGCVAEDLNKLVNRATHSAWMRIENETSNNRKLLLKEIDFDVALKNFLPLCLHGINLYKNETKCWSDVGGLSDVKKTLYEILFWPLKYPALFDNCPIRLQSGIILYGPPGTGKTLLAGVIAKESGLNFITVKGPEIFSILM